MTKKLFIIFSYLLLSRAIYSIGITPTRYLFLSSHNEICEGSFTIVNDHNIDMPVSVEIQEGIKSIENKKLPSVSQWLKIEKENFVLSPGEKRSINFKVIVPENTSGTFSARISFVDKSQQAFSTSMTVPIYIIVKGTEIVDWTVQELKIKNTPVGLSGSLTIENNGNVIFHTLGKLVIKDKKGKEVFSTQAGGGNAVFPNNKIITPLNVKDLNLKPGKYYAYITLSGYNNETKNFKFEIIKTKDDKYQIKKLEK